MASSYLSFAMDAFFAQLAIKCPAASATASAFDVEKGMHVMDPAFAAFRDSRFTTPLHAIKIDVDPVPDAPYKHQPRRHAFRGDGGANFAGIEGIEGIKAKRQLVFVD
jgi:hypothetical protein